MFGHIFTYRLKCLLRDKETIFWTLLFPLLLATFFKMAFSNLNTSTEAFQAINVAVVDDAQFQSDVTFKAVLDNVSKGDDKLFNLSIVPLDKAEQLLKDNSVQGYIVVGAPTKLIVKNSGMSQSIIKSFIEDYNQTMASATSILSENPDKHEELAKDLQSRLEYVREIPGTSAAPDNILAYFYSLIAMACFYGCFFGNREVTDIQANISQLAARINIAPVHKLKTLLYSMSASLAIHFVELLVFLAYLVFALKVDFGAKIGYVLLTTLLGSVAGLSFGSLISAAVKKSEGMKIAILLGTTMFCSFLAGLMYQNMKYIIQRYVPLLSYLNPINLLTDAFYCLYYYDTLNRYALNMGALIIFIVLFCAGTYFITRRRKYASL